MPSSFLLFCQCGTNTALKPETQGSSSLSSKNSFFQMFWASASKLAEHPPSGVTLSKGLGGYIGC